MSPLQSRMWDVEEVATGGGGVGGSGDGGGGGDEGDGVG